VVKVDPHGRDLRLFAGHPFDRGLAGLCLAVLFDAAHAAIGQLVPHVVRVAGNCGGHGRSVPAMRAAGEGRRRAAGIPGRRDVDTAPRLSGDVPRAPPGKDPIDDVGKPEDDGNH
jgi:hypothetical protein